MSLTTRDAWFVHLELFPTLRRGLLSGGFMGPGQTTRPCLLTSWRVATRRGFLVDVLPNNPGQTRERCPFAATQLRPRTQQWLPVKRRRRGRMSDWPLRPFRQPAERADCGSLTSSAGRRPLGYDLARKSSPAELIVSTGSTLDPGIRHAELVHILGRRSMRASSAKPIQSGIQTT